MDEVDSPLRMAEVHVNESTVKHHPALFMEVGNRRHPFVALPYFTSVFMFLTEKKGIKEKV